MKYNKTEAHNWKDLLAFMSLCFILVFSIGITSCKGDSSLLQPLTNNKSQISQSSNAKNAISLRSIADIQDFHIGSVVQARYLRDEQFSTLVQEQFNTIVPENEMKFETIHPEPYRYNFEPADEIASFAKENNLFLRGHTLVWEQQLPQWILGNQYKKEDYKAILKDHIFSVVTHYKGQIYAWDVVNEALDENGLFKNTIWLQMIGPEYIALSFKWAHEADPDALLFYNDFSGDMSGKKTRAIYALADGLLAQRIPINGIGLQMHTFINTPPNPEELFSFIEDINDLGLKVHITEMEVGIGAREKNQDLEKALEKQALIYYQILMACVNAPDCDTLITWGLTDAYTWRLETSPTLFDEQNKKKPSYYAVFDVLSK